MGLMGDGGPSLLILMGDGGAYFFVMVNFYLVTIYLYKFE